MVRGLILAAPLTAILASGVAAAPVPVASDRLTVADCRLDGVDETLRCGGFRVPENRGTRQGQMINLRFVVLPARGARRPEPIFYFVGGPGQTATEFVQRLAGSRLRDGHDLILLDERGTGGDNRLDCPGPDGGDLQAWLTPPYSAANARACRRALEGRFDLRQYTTPASADDVDEIRRALGYERINLVGGSFGTYAALAYIRRYGVHVRSAVFSSVVLPESRVPVAFPQTAQQALEAIAADCAADPACHAAFPDPTGDLRAVLSRLRADPVAVQVRHPDTGAPEVVRLTEAAFVDAVRVMMYRADRGRRLPLLLRQAAQGDFRTFAESALVNGRAFYRDSRFGLYLSVTCSEMVARIRPEEVEPAARGSFLGDWRIRGQMAACAEWPRTALPKGALASFRSQVPVLLVSGAYDPAVSQRWGEVAKRRFPNSLHLVLPTGHAPNDDCVGELALQLMARGSVRGLEASCAARMRPPPFAMPEGVRGQGPG